MPKIVVTPVVGTFTTSFASSVNHNFKRVQDELDNCLSRDGTAPNSVSADIDMNGCQLSNLRDSTALDSACTVRHAMSLVEGIPSYATEEEGFKIKRAYVSKDGNLVIEYDDGV